jgi:hypothetical protein
MTTAVNHGTWRCVAAAQGSVDLPAPGGDASGLAERAHDDPNPFRRRGD